MPLYEYVCTKCSKEFEELILNEDDQVCCPECGDKQAKKLLSCCRAKFAGASAVGQSSGPAFSGGGACSSCSGGSCASCG